jgi:hypothetical protein
MVVEIFIFALVEASIHRQLSKGLDTIPRFNVTRVQFFTFAHEPIDKIVKIIANLDKINFINSKLEKKKNA